MKTPAEWVDDIVGAWVGDDPINYAYHIACLYNTLDMTMVTQVITEVNEQQASYLEEAKENPYKPL